MALAGAFEFAADFLFGLGFGFGLDGFKLRIAELGFFFGSQDGEVDEVDGDHREQGDADDAEEDGGFGLEITNEGPIGEDAGFGIGRGSDGVGIWELGPYQNGNDQVKDEDCPFNKTADKEDFLLFVHDSGTFDGLSNKNIPHAGKRN